MSASCPYGLPKLTKKMGRVPIENPALDASDNSEQKLARLATPNERYGT